MDSKISKKWKCLIALLILIGFVILFVKINSKQNEFKMITRGPGSCVDILILNEDGTGKLMRGKTTVDYKDEFVKFDSKEKDEEFKVTSDNDLTSINAKIDSISKLKVYKGNFAWDGKHTEIFINGIKKIDVYGFRNNEQIFFYMKLFKYLPYDYNTFCN
jgi:hypothetical protein